MVTGAGEELQRNIDKGWRTYDEAVKDDAYLREHEWTGVNWDWRNQNGKRVQGSQLS